MIIKVNISLTKDKFNSLWGSLKKQRNEGLIILPNYCELIYKDPSIPVKVDTVDLILAIFEDYPNTEETYIPSKENQMIKPKNSFGGDQMIKFEDFLERMLGRKLYVHESKTAQLMTEEPRDRKDIKEDECWTYETGLYKGLKAAQVFYDESIDWINGGEIR